MSAKKLATALICALGPAIWLCMAFSPRIGGLLFGYSSSAITTRGSTRDCTLLRRGKYHTDGIQCMLDYRVGDRAVSAQALVWESDDAFIGLDGLHHQLATFNRGGSVEIQVDPRYPDRPDILPTQWLAFPAWALGMLFYVGLFAAIVLASGKFSLQVAHRADYDYDEQGRLVPVRFGHAGRGRWLRLVPAVLWCLLFGATLYAWANRPANQLLLSAHRGLVEVPAILIHCAAGYSGSYKGHDQTECELSYRWQGAERRGQAEALDFRLFPTAARVDDAADVVEGQHVLAYVDPAQPSYAIAFVSNAWFAPQGWGLIELMLPIWLGIGLICALGVSVNTPKGWPR